MTLDWQPFVNLVKERNTFLLTTHIRPDADGLGSMLGLADILEALGKQVSMVIASAWPPRYDFLDPDRRIARFRAPGDEFRHHDAIVILDTGTWNQLGDFGPFLKTLPAPKMVIDHHLSQDDLGAVQLVDTSAEATGRLVFEAIEALGAPIPEKAANHLFAALAMDTGWFRHSNTTPATFSLAQHLMERGARPTHLFEMLFEQNSLPRLKLMGLTLDRLQVAAEGMVAYSEVLRGDYARTGAIPQDTEDLINLVRSLAGVEVAIFFMEQPAGGVKVSFRSRMIVDVAQLAEKFGGGGHRRASGAILPDPIEEARSRVLEAVEEALGRR